MTSSHAISLSSPQSTERVKIGEGIISSMTFIGFPGMTYQEDWRYMAGHLLFLPPALVGCFVFLPFFRRGHVR